MNELSIMLNANRPFRNVILALAIVGTLFVAAKTLNEIKRSSYIGRDSVMLNTLAVSGEGQAIAIPDTANFSFTVTENATIVADAQKKVSEKINNTLAFLKKSDVGEGDTKTVNYSIYPKYEYQSYPCTQWSCPPAKEPKIIGYEVSQTLEVKVRKLEKAGDLLSGVGGVSVSNVSNLTFTTENEEALQNEARTKAINKAKEKAEALAKQLGVKLVRITNYSEGGNYYNKFISYGAADGRGGAESPSVEVPAGENKIVSNVTITYEIR